MSEMRVCPACKSENVIFSKKRQVFVCEDCQGDVPDPVLPTQVFFSYGHDPEDGNETLVRQIMEDLKRRGHAVWFDRFEIKGGNDWRSAIAQGIRGADQFMSFLSEHSTRRPGVCLDEIGIAVAVRYGQILTVLVEPEEAVKPPPSVSHIHRIDMHEWKEKREEGGDAWRTWYCGKFAEICRAIESKESQRFAGEMGELRDLLMPVESHTRIRELLGKPYEPRDWLAGAVETWRCDQKRRSSLFWLKGEAGTGKSAFAAHLSHYGGGTVVAAHFCQWDKRDYCDPQRAVRTLAFQLAARLPDYRNWLLQHRPEIGELDRKTASELFDYLITSPLGVAIDGQRESYLMVVDALDEAEEGERNELAEVLARGCPNLPRWLGVVVTSRPETNIEDLFRRTTVDGRVLDVESERDGVSTRDDIGKYVRHRLARKLEKCSNPEGAVGHILSKSKGIFLYAECVCDDVLSPKGELSLDRLHELPDGLPAVFLSYMHRQFPDIAQFRSGVRPALRAILAACEPLPVEVLQHLFDWKADERNDFTRSLGSLFPVVTDGETRIIQTFHRSLAECLTDEETAGAYFVSVADGHELLADRGWEEYLRGPACMSDYFLRNLPAHLLALGRTGESEQLLLDFAHLLEKVRRGMLDDLLRDAEDLASSLGEGSVPVAVVAAFLREQAHILRRGNDAWPAYKILLQLALEHADTSPVTVAAEKWLSEGQCNWEWSRNALRPMEVSFNPCRLVLEGHSQDVTGMFETSSGEIISWSDDGTCRVWDLQSGRELLAIENFGTLSTWWAGAPGAVELPGQQVLVWAGSPEIKRLDIESRTVRTVFRHHGERWHNVRGLLPLGDGRIVSWGEDYMARVWELESGTELHSLEHQDWVKGGMLLSDGRFLTWCGEDGEHILHIWNLENGAECVRMVGHTGKIQGVVELPTGHLFSWAQNDSYRIWTCDGKAVPHAELHGGLPPRFAMPDGQVMQPTRQGENGLSCIRLNQFTVKFSKGEHPLSFPRIQTKGAKKLSAGNVIFWGEGCLYTLLPGDGVMFRTSVEQITSRGENSVEIGGLIEVKGDGVCFWAGKVAWINREGCLMELVGHTDDIQGMLQLSDRHLGNLLSWSDDGTLRVWDVGTGELLHVLHGHNGKVMEAMELSDGRIASRSWLWASTRMYGDYLKDDTTLRVWEVPGPGQTVAAPLPLVTGLLQTVGEKGLACVETAQADNPCEEFWLVDADAEDGFRPVPGSAPEEVVRWCVLSDGRLAILGKPGPTVAIRDGVSGELLRTWEDRHSAWGLVRGEDTSKFFTVADSVLGFCDPDRGLLAEQPHDVKDCSAFVTCNSELLLWGGESINIRGWNPVSGQTFDLSGHTGAAQGVRELASGNVLSWSADCTLRIWDSVTHAPLSALEGARVGPRSSLAADDTEACILELSNGMVLWCSPFWKTEIQSPPEGPWTTCGVWDYAKGVSWAIATDEPVKAAIELADGRVLLLFVAKDSPPRVVSLSGSSTISLTGCDREPIGAMDVGRPGVITWHPDGSFRLWRRETGELVSTTCVVSASQAAINMQVTRVESPQGPIVQCVAGPQLSLLDFSRTDPVITTWHCAYDITRCRRTEKGAMLVSGRKGLFILKPCESPQVHVRG